MKLLIKIINNLTKGLIKMSLLLDKQQEINNFILNIAANLKAKILALIAEVVTLTQEKAQLEAEIVTLQDTLANIGTAEDLQNIIQPAEDALTEAQNL